MHPEITIDFFGYQGGISSTLFILAVLTPSMFAIWLMNTRFLMSFTKATFIFFSTAVSALFGGRIFHLIFEKKDLFQADVFKGDGFTFYGALLFGMLNLWIWTKNSKKIHRVQIWDWAVFATAFSYGALRIGCFLQGCCWGKVSFAPWAVQFKNSASAMPSLWIPVHPTQIYDAILGFSLAAFILIAIQWRSSGFGTKLFFILYPIGRTITEFYRGDGYRGVDQVVGLSTSQWISIAILFFIATEYLIRKSERQSYAYQN